MINFINESRSYDITRHAVRFWGYEGAQEISFFVLDAALRKFSPHATTEDDYLASFGINRKSILAAATRVYGKGRKGSYEVGAGDV